jgi:hypothetical protein
MNFTLGSSCPTYQPLSMNRAAFFPGLRSTGSVHSDRIAGRTDLYFGLQPLQSTSLTAFGIIPADAALPRPGAEFPPRSPRVLLAPVADAGPVRVSWQAMTATVMVTSAAFQAGRAAALAARIRTYIPPLYADWAGGRTGRW